MMKRFDFDELLNIMARLRGPNGCPWDREQTHESILRCLVEETYEFAEAVHGTHTEGMREELGDLLLQVVFHCQLASERGAFDIKEVIQEISEKLIRRHPHVFAGESAESSSEVLERWERIKAEEKPGARSSALDGVPQGMPPLAKAEKIQKKAAKAGLDFRDEGEAFEKLEEEMRELREALRSNAGAQQIEEELGDLLFSAVNVARHQRLDAATALSKSIGKFCHRFDGLEKIAASKGLPLGDLSPSELNDFWERTKEADSTGPDSPKPKGEPRRAD